VVQGLLRGEPMDFHGRFFDFDRGWIRPAPEPPIPFLIGGRADAALERAARFGDGWLGIWSSPRRVAAVIRQIDGRAAELGRPPLPRHGVQLWIGIDDDRAVARARLARGMEAFYRVPFEKLEKYSPYGTADEVAEQLTAYVDAGCRFFNLMSVAADDAQGINAVARIRARLRTG